MGLALEGNVCWGFRTIESGRKEKSKYMAELVNKYPQNAAGSFYVDDLGSRVGGNRLKTL